MKMTEITCACGCGQKKMVRTADVKRGWGKYIDKSHKAIHQAKSKPFNRATNKSRSKPIHKQSPERRAKVLLDALYEERISEQWFAAKFPIEMEHTLPRHLQELIADESVGHMMSSGMFGHGQE